MNENQIPKTVVELEQWMKDRCYNFLYYSINGNFVYEGNGLEFYKGAYQWCCYDRSQKQIHKRFKQEAQAVAYAFEKITADPTANRNIVGLYKPDELKLITEHLENLNIEYKTNQILYQKEDLRTYVSVIGCDIKKVIDLVQKAYKNFQSTL